MARLQNDHFGNSGLGAGTTRDKARGTGNQPERTKPGPAGAPHNELGAQAPARQATQAPLTAEFKAVPAGHDGESDFRFRVKFTANITANQRKFPQAFQVTGGEVKQTRQVDNRKDLWEVTVTPAGNEAVVITLPGKRECGTGGMPCAKAPHEQGWMPLSNSPTATVAGPVLVSVANAEGSEGINGAVVFILSLSRDTGGTFTVDYQTQDYTALEGTISFAPGKWEKSITVALVDGDDPEPVETFSITLSNPS